MNKDDISNAAPPPKFSLDILYAWIKGEVDAHIGETGKKPSALVLGYECYQVLRTEPLLRYECNSKTGFLDKFDGMKVFWANNVEKDHVEVF